MTIQQQGQQTKVLTGLQKGGELTKNTINTVWLTDGGESLFEQVRIASKELTRLAQQLSAGGLQ